MNAASKELCKELYDLSGWKTPYFFTEEVLGKDSDYQNIRYDAGYLLRKLQIPKTTVIVGTIGRNSKRYSATYIPDELGKYDFETMHHKASTPEDAICKLAIGLFKQGIVDKENE